MTDQLQKEIKQAKPFPTLEVETFLNLQRTSNLLLQTFANHLKLYKLTPAQYNVLRILRGAHPHALPSGEVGGRMVTPEPDITRLLDRLEKRGLIVRARDHEKDRRVVNVRIAEGGLELLVELDQRVTDWLKDLLGHMDGKKLRTLVKLLEDARRGLQ